MVCPMNTIFSLRERKTAFGETAAAICISLPEHSCCEIVVSLMHCVKMKTKCLPNKSELGIVVWGWTLCSLNNDLFEFTGASALTFCMSQIIIFFFFFLFVSWWSMCTWEVILIKIYVVSKTLLLYCFFFPFYTLEVKESDHILPLKINLYQLHAFGQLFYKTAVSLCRNKNICEQLEWNLLFYVMNQFCWYQYEETN